MSLKRIFGVSLSLAKAEFKLKNEGTWLGNLWYVLGPLLTFILLLNIFQDRLGVDIPNYPLYLLIGILVFNYFGNITKSSTRAIRDNSLIRGIVFPKESIIFSKVFGNLFSHLFEILILIFFLLFFGISLKGLIFYPIILVIVSLFSLGIGLILASIGVYIFDLDNLWIFASTFLWFVTPIFYEIGGQGRLSILNLFNPMYYFITIARDLMIYMRMPELWMILMAIFYTLFSLLVGLLIFNKLKVKFAELI